MQSQVGTVPFKRWGDTGYKLLKKCKKKERITCILLRQKGKKKKRGEGEDHPHISYT